MSARFADKTLGSHVASGSGPLSADRRPWTAHATPLATLTMTGDSTRLPERSLSLRPSRSGETRMRSKLLVGQLLLAVVAGVLIVANPVVADAATMARCEVKARQPRQRCAPISAATEGSMVCDPAILPERFNNTVCLQAKRGSRFSMSNAARIPNTRVDSTTWLMCAEGRATPRRDTQVQDPCQRRPSVERHRRTRLFAHLQDDLLVVRVRTGGLKRRPAAVIGRCRGLLRFEIRTMVSETPSSMRPARTGKVNSNGVTDTAARRHSLARRRGRLVGVSALASFLLTVVTPAVPFAAPPERTDVALGPVEYLADRLGLPEDDAGSVLLARGNTGPIAFVKEGFRQRRSGR